MIVCKRCNNIIPTLNFSEEQLSEIFYLVSQDLKLEGVKKMMNVFKVSHKDAKLIMDHFNYPFGHCMRCNNTNLDKENMECPKCKSFNYNLKIESNL